MARPRPGGNSGNGEADRASFELLNTLIGHDHFKVQIAQRFALGDVVAAHAAMERHHLGRVVLTVAA